MTKAKTIRFEENLESRMAEYAETNDIKLNKLVNMAVEKYISEPQTITLEPISNSDWESSMTTSFIKNKKAMDELK